MWSSFPRFCRQRICSLKVTVIILTKFTCTSNNFLQIFNSFFVTSAALRVRRIFCAKPCPEWFWACDPYGSPNLCQLYARYDWSILWAVFIVRFPPWCFHLMTLRMQEMWTSATRAWFFKFPGGAYSRTPPPPPPPEAHAFCSRSPSPVHSQNPVYGLALLPLLLCCNL